MVNAVHDFELAPVAVLRAAAWPIESLATFGDRALADLTHSDLSTPEHWDRYIEAYQNTCDREREALWRRTVDDPRFMKALLLSNPLVAKRVTLLQSRRQERTKAIRRLENTLYRYLARAVGRTTPGGLWAGVVSVTTGPQTQVQDKAPQYVFTPDLRPFQSILRILGRRSPYWENTLWRINPTVAPPTDGSWQWWAKSSVGLTERRSLPAGSIDPLIRMLMQLPKGTFADLTQSLAQRLGVADLLGIRAALEQLALGGMLLGGLDLPTTFTTPWEALHSAEQLLHAPERQPWQQTVEALQQQCASLANNLEQLSAEAVTGILAEASQNITALIVALGIEPFPLPEPILHCDYGLPYQIEMGPVEQNSLQQTLADYEREWLQGWSPASVLRLEQLQLQRQKYKDGVEISAIGFSQVPMPSSLTWESLCTVYPALSPSLDAWNNLLLSPQADLNLPAEAPVLPLPLAPWGCLYVQLQRVFETSHSSLHSPPSPPSLGGSDPQGSPRLAGVDLQSPPILGDLGGECNVFGTIQTTSEWHQTVQGISDHVAQAFSRFGPLLSGNTLFRDWCQGHLTNFATRYQLQIAEIQEPLEQNPNVLARPSFQLPVLSLWSDQFTRPSFSLQGAMLRLDPLTQLPLLHLKDCPHPIAVFGFASAHISAGNPIADQLLQTGFQASPAAIFRATSLPVPGEFAAPRFTPKVLLANGQTLRSRRTVLSGSQWTELIEAPAEKRFILWQCLAVEQGWPRLLNVEVATEAPLLIPRDSPLALAALFKGLSADSPYAIVEAADEPPWLVDEQGNHYQSELAQPFRRTHHGWSARAVDNLPSNSLEAKSMSCPN